MKKILSVILAVLLMVSVMPTGLVNLTAKAESMYSYTTDEGFATITGVDTSIAGDVVIPDFLGGCPVTAIGPYAFQYCDQMTSVSIHEGVTSIWESAFEYCDALKTAWLPESLSFIGSYAFANCKSLESIILPENVTEIQHDTFYNCPALVEVYFGSELYMIGDYAFAHCTSLGVLNLPISLTNINCAAFSGCTALTDVYYTGSQAHRTQMLIAEQNDAVLNATWHYNWTGEPEVPVCNHVYTDDYTLDCSLCGELREVESNTVFVGDVEYRYLENSGDIYYMVSGSREGVSGEVEIRSEIFGVPVTDIGYEAFYNKKDITAVSIPNSVTGIGYNAFGYCTGITELVIPDSVVYIAGGAFVCCENLTDVTIGNGVETIDYDVFQLCTSLENVTMGNNVKTIGLRAFSGCSNLTEIVVPDSVITIGEYAFYECVNLANVVIGNGVETIEERAFEGCFDLISVTLGNSVKTIGEAAFHACESLQSITLPDSLETIGANTFFECISLESARMGNSVKTIGEQAFHACSSLKEISIPESVQTIGDFAFTYCDSLEAITVSNDNEYYSSEDGVLFNKDKTKLIQYPVGNKATSYVIPESVVTIKNAAFCECKNLEAITLPLSVTGVCETAFYGCDNLSDVYYRGTKEQSESIAISANNYGLSDASWHFNSCIGSEEHTYDNNADLSCNICGNVRPMPDNCPTFTVNGDTVRAGDTFTVDLAIKNNSGICSFKVDVGYDANLLELVSYVGKDYPGIVFGPAKNNPFAISWVGALSENTTDGVIATLTFKVKEGAAVGKTDITLSYDPDNVYDFDFENVYFATQNGTVDIIEYTPGDVNNDGKINNKDIGLIQRLVCGWDITIIEKAADVNKDGAIDNKDVGILERFVNGWEEELK